MRRYDVEFWGWLDITALDEEDALDKAYGPIHEAILPLKQQGREITWKHFVSHTGDEGEFVVDFTGQIRVTAGYSEGAEARARDLIGESLNTITNQGKRGGWAIGAVYWALEEQAV